MEVSIILVNYNTLEMTKNAIDSILEKTQDLSYEIILVDNNSNDGSQEYFSNLELKNFKYIQSGKNLGFGKANNLGYSFATGKYIFLLNTDTLLVNNAIKLLYEKIKEDSSIGVVGGNLYDENMNPVTSFQKEIYSLRTEFYFLKRVWKKISFQSGEREDFNYTDEDKEVGCISGADMLIRRECIEKIGFFDPDFFMYFEETELTFRIKKAGYKILSVPAAKIIHLEGKSFKFKETRFQMYVESKYKYLGKVYGENYINWSYVISQLKYLLIPTKANLKKFQLNKNEYIKIGRGEK
jgi:hypothetical protein